MLTPDRFFYRTDFATWSPVDIPQPLPIEPMMKFAEAANQIVENKLKAMRDLKAGVFKTDAYLDQDIDYRKKALESIQETGEKFAKMDLLSPESTQQLYNEVDKWAYDPELLRIASTTEQIRNSYKVFDKAVMEGKTSMANFYPVLQSIEEENARYNNSHVYNSKVSIDTKLRPFVDINERIKEAVELVEPNAFSNIEYDSKNGTMYIINTEEKTAETIATAVFSTLGDDGKEQLRLEYNYVQSTNPESLLIPGTEEFITFNDFVANKAINAGEAFKNKKEKISDLQESVNSRHSFTMKIEKMKIDAANERARQNRQSNAAAIANLQTSGGTSISSIIQTPVGVNSTKIAQILSETMAAEKQATSNYAALVVDLPLSVLSYVIESPEKLLHVLTTAGGMRANADTLTKALQKNNMSFTLVNDLLPWVTTPGNFEKFTQNYNKLNTTQEDLEVITAQTDLDPEELNKIWELSGELAKENLKAQNSSVFNLGSLPYMLQKAGRALYDKISTSVNPAGTTQQEVFKNIMENRTTPFTQARAYGNKAKDLGTSENMLFAVTGTTTGTDMKQFQTDLKAIADRVTFDGAMFNGEVVKIASKAGTSKVIVPIIGGNRGIMYLVKYTDTTGKEKEQYIDVPESHKTQIKGVLSNNILDEIQAAQHSGEEIDLGSIRAQLKAISTITGFNRYTDAPLNTKHLDNRTVPKTIVTAYGKVTKNITDVGQSVDIVSNGNKVSISVYYVKDATNGFNYILGHKDPDGKIIVIPIDKGSLTPSSNGITYMDQATALATLQVMYLHNTANVSANVTRSNLTDAERQQILTIQQQSQNESEE